MRLGFIVQFFLFLWSIFLLPQIVSKFFEDAGYVEFYFGRYLDFTDFIFKNAELYAGRQSSSMKFTVFLRSVNSVKAVLGKALLHYRGCFPSLV